MANLQDVYWVDVMPAMDKILPAMRRALPAVMRTAGGQAGGDFSDSFTRTTVSAVEKASSQLAAARKKDTAASAAAEAASRKEADAAGRVAVARARLAELVDKGTASTSQMAAATERLASAQRGHEGAASALTRAQQGQQDATDGVTRATRLLSEQQSKAETGSDQLSRSMRDGDKASDTASRGMDRVKGSLGGLVTALGAGATVISAFWDSVGAEKDTDMIAGRLGLDPAAAQRAGAVAGGLYRDAYGENLTEVTDAVDAVMSSLDGMRNASDTDLRAATANALNFASAYKIDVNEAVSSAGILMRTGLAKDATEAFDLMTAALQKVPAALRPAILEATDEYGKFFADLGFSGEQTMALLVDASAKGEFGIDKIGDALLEFSGRTIDMSSGTTAVYETLGLDAQTMANRVLAGGEIAQGAFQQIVAGLQSIEDPSLRANSAIALFGTPLEDLGTADIPAFLTAMTMANGELENVTGTAARLGDTISSNTATRFEEMKRTTMGFVQDGLVALADGFTTGQSTASGWQGTLQTVGGVLQDVFTGGQQALAAFTAAWSYNDGEVTSSGLNGWMERLGYWAHQAFDYFRDSVIPTVMDFADVVGPILTGALSTAGDVFGWFAEHETAADVATGGLVATLGSIAAVQIGTGIVDRVTGIKDSILDTRDQVVEFKDGVLEMKDTVVSGFNTVKDGVSAVKTGAQNLAAGWSNAQAAASGFTGTAGTVGGALRTAATSTWGAITATGSWIATQATSAATAVASAATTAGAWVASTARTTASLVTQSAAFVAQRAVMVGGAIATGVVTAAQWALNAAMSANPIGMVVIALTALVGGLVWAWNNVDWFRDAVTTAWTWIQSATSFAWNNVIKPVFDAFGAAGSWLWNNVLSPVFNGIATGWDALGSGFQWVWNNLLSPVFGWFGGVLTTMKDSFTTAVDWIGTTWNGLKDKLMAPVQWVIDFVWNDGLRKLWNTINNLWDGDDLPTFQLASGGVISTGAGTSGAGGTSTRLATGGVLPGYTPGRDVHLFTSPTGGRLELSGGEAVMRPEWTRVLGRPTIDYWNSLARTQGEAGLRRVLSTPRTADAGRGDPPSPQAYASGGIIDLPGWLDTTLDFIPGGGVVTEVIDAINGGSGFGAGSWGDALVGTVKTAGSKLWDAASSLFGGGSDFGGVRPIGDGGGNGGGFGAALSWARQQAGKPYIWGGVGPAGYDCSGFMSAITNVIRGRSPYSRVGATSSFPWAGFAPGTGPFTIGSSKNTGSGIGHMAGTLLGVNVESRGNDGVVVGPRARGAGDGLFTTRAALFDDGGLWGDGLGLNLTGGVERVLTPEQDDYFRRFVDVAGHATGQAVSLHQVRVFIGDRDITDIVRTEVEDIDGERADEMRAELAAAGLI